MEKEQHVFGRTVLMDGPSAIRMMETAFCEGYAGDQPPSCDEAENHNIYGREVSSFPTNDLSGLAGMAAGGLRTGALLTAKALRLNYSVLSDLLRRNLPVVFHFQDRLDQNGPSALSGTGYFHLFASDNQEAIDFSLIARRIAELALIPGIIESDLSNVQEVHFPGKQLVREFLGSPDDAIPCPTPAQEIIFGKQRRRVPNWFNFDTPTLLGASKGEISATLETASRQQYFQKHLPALTDQVFGAFRQLTGKDYRFIIPYQAEKADYLVITFGLAGEQLKKAADQFRKETGKKVGCLDLKLLHPFPAEELEQFIHGKKGITLLEPVHGGSGSLVSQLIRTICHRSGKRAPEFYSGYYGARPSAEDLMAVFRNMTKEGEKLPQFYIDIDFTHSQSSSPQHEILLQSITRAYPEISKETLSGAPKKMHSAQKAQGPVLNLPYTIRQYRDQGPPYTRLSRFYNDTARFYETGEYEEIVADPFQAVPAIPPATANFSGVAVHRKKAPVFSPGECTGCGDCFLYCPHSALPPLALSPEALIRGGMDIAAKRGTPLTQFTPLVRNLAKTVAQVIRKSEGKIRKAGDFLPEAFQNLTAKMNWNEEKLDSLTSEFETLMSVLRDFPAAVTDPFFGQPEQIESGSGALFSIAVDPHSCTGCGLCAELCQTDALSMETQSVDLLRQMQDDFQLWEELPDTDAGIIQRMHHREDYPSLAALLLSRNFYLSMTGGAPDEKDSAKKTALHLVTAVTESVMQPRFLRITGEIDALIKTLTETINNRLSDALPHENFEGLLKVIRQSDSPRMSIDEIVGRKDVQEELKPIEIPALRRKVELLEALKTLKWELLEGPTGAGRARYGLLSLDDPGTWIGRHPFNVFAGPVMIGAAGSSLETITGLIQGQIRHILDNIRILRRARLEASGNYQPAIHDQEIAALSWDKLEDGERELLPPFLLVGRKREAANKYPGQINRLLASSMPIKLVLTDDGVLPGDTAPDAVLAGEYALVFSALAGSDAFVFQGAPDASDFFFKGLTEGLKEPGPALFILAAPDLQSFDPGNTPWPALYGLARKTRSLPILKRSKQTERSFLSTSLSLDGNESPDQDWHAPAPDEGNEGQSYTLTYADWLAIQEPWQKEFERIDPGDDSAILVDRYLTLDDSGRKDKRPVVRRAGQDGQFEQLAASDKVIRAAAAVKRHWLALKEIAGLTTPFPKKMRAEVEKELNEKHQAAASELQRTYEEKLRRKEAELMEKVKIQLREKLLALSKKG